MPLLRNLDKSKISKRKNPVSIDYYQDAGILPHALLNFLAMPGAYIAMGMFIVFVLASDLADLLELAGLGDLDPLRQSLAGLLLHVGDHRLFHLSG